MKYVKHLKKIINYTVLFALLLSLIPLQAAQAADIKFFIPDDKKLADSSAIDPVITPTGLNRTNAMISNSSTIAISGIFQQVTSTSMALTVQQMVSVTPPSGVAAWTEPIGMTFNTPVSVSSTNIKRFQVSNVQLFEGYNKLTFTGLNGLEPVKNVFYVLYDRAPILNTLQIFSDSETYELNESTSLVVRSSSAYIQGTTTNVTSVFIDGIKASVLNDGRFDAPAINLKPGLNKLEIKLSNATDSVVLRRQVYYYTSASPFTIVEATQDSVAAGDPPLGEVNTDLLASTPPTFTGTAPGATMKLQFLIPYSSTPLTTLNTTLTVGGVVTPVTGLNDGTVITNTYGASAFKLVELSGVPLDLSVVSAEAKIKFVFAPGGTTTPIVVEDAFPFIWASGKTIVKSVALIPKYDPAPAIFDDTVLTQPLDGSQVITPEFYVLVEASKPLVAGELKVALQPLGLSPITITEVDLDIHAGNVKNKGQIFKITDLPQGTQTIAFSVSSDPVSKTAKVTFVSKNYIELENLYEGQVFSINELPVLKGAAIGFDNRMQGLQGRPQLIINNIDWTDYYPTAAAVPYLIIDSSTGMISTAEALKLPETAPVGPGPLLIGENVLKIIINYRDTTDAQPYLRQYVKEVKFYIVNSNTPKILDVRPLTPPAKVTIQRGNLSSSTKTDYLPASPEFILGTDNNYTTSLTKMDFYLEGSGAVDVIISKDGAQIYRVTPPVTVSEVNSVIDPEYTSVDVAGNSNAFKIRLNNVLIPLGTHTFTISMLNASGATTSYTMTVLSQKQAFEILSPRANTGDKIIVNKNFVLFDVLAAGATDVLINGKSAVLRDDLTNRYVYTLTGLKADSENKIAVVVKRPSGDLTDTVTVNYVSNPAVGAMYMEPMGTKHSVFDKAIQLTFPKNNVLRRVIDGKIQPQVDLLFGLANPKDGNTELVNDYNQIVGKDPDDRTSSRVAIPIDPALSNLVTSTQGRMNFMRISDLYWISGGLGERLVGDYKSVTGGVTPYSTDGPSLNTFTKYESERIIAPSERGTLVLRYDDNVVDQAASEVTVFFMGDKAGTKYWENLGGVVDTKAKTITVPFDKFGYYMVGKLKFGYDDITKSSWARNILQALLAKGYMNAMFSDDFGVKENATRGEFATILVRALGMKPNYDDTNSFNDVLPGSGGGTILWDYESVETAARAGIVQGVSERIFGVGDFVTREQAAVMISRAMNLKMAMNDAKLKANVFKAFADGDSIDYYNLPAVDAVNSLGIMVGSPVVSPLPSTAKPLLNFRPTSYITRDEIGQIAVRILQKYSKALPATLS
ncbi:S-layer homology domain-containing protein [Paenibacillus agricola]|uniref:S-layer homology domain-containing protein n=1 Tax=Paenibacillus agricola TaxID=2716264 RepID=A0ABX0JF18_9BACL|nr:S-layer homology domain-containing protein [Paenibacillus agricola]NHN32295.1 S-layer homology domain-containing protein [Paenibacillus agricola]